jgi:FtsH-binding integral membrane protein
MPGLALIFAICLALTHLGARHFSLARAVPRSRWLSLAGGTSVAYVFVHILPELQKGQDAMVRAELPLEFLEHHVYIVALLGFVTFYGLERLAVRSRRRIRVAGGEDATGPMVFWIHSLSFACLNALVGYLLLHREQPGMVNLSFFFVAMGAHFLVNDYGLRRHHQEAYERVGCWLLAGSVLAGYGIGLLTPIHELMLAVLFAFLAGGVILNVIKEELPEEQESLFWAFALGAALYTALLLAL